MSSVYGDAVVFARAGMAPFTDMWGQDQETWALSWCMGRSCGLGFMSRWMGVSRFACVDSLLFIAGKAATPGDGFTIRRLKR